MRKNASGLKRHRKRLRCHLQAVASATARYCMRIAHEKLGILYYDGIKNNSPEEIPDTNLFATFSW